MKTFNLADAAKIMNSQGSPSGAFKGAAVDSRLIEAGQLFFALEGGNTDGHNFLSDVSAKKAAAAVVKKDYKGPDFGLPLLRVENTLQALQELARRTQEQRKAKIIGITGSLGKTSTKEFLVALLKQKYKVCFTPGNSNTQTGVPLAIFNHATDEDEIFVVEMGMTHSNQIKSLISIAPPDVAILTTIAWVHGVNFSSLLDIAKAKAEIFLHPKTRLGILNYDIEYFDEVYRTGTSVKSTFSSQSHYADYFIETEQNNIFVTEKGEKVVLGPWPIFGDHLQVNFLGAVAAARHYGLDWDHIRKGLTEIKNHDRRMQLVEKKGVLFLNDSYNAAVPSLKAALKSLPTPQSGGRKIGVIGEMLELGPLTEESHRVIGNYALDYVDQVFCLGKGCKTIEECWNQKNRPVQLFMDRNELLQALKKEVKPGDVVLLKGSRANNLWKILEEF